MLDPGLPAAGLVVGWSLAVTLAFCGTRWVLGWPVGPPVDLFYPIKLSPQGGLSPSRSCCRCGRGGGSSASFCSFLGTASVCPSMSCRFLTPRFGRSLRYRPRGRVFRLAPFPSGVAPSGAHGVRLRFLDLWVLARVPRFRSA